MSRRTDESQVSELEDLLSELLEEAQKKWPKVQLSEAQFFSHLAGRLKLDGESEILDALSKVHVGDLYLACACAEGDAAALAAVDVHYFINLDRALARFSARDNLVEEVKQRLRKKLFVGEDGPPKIIQYTGRGDLGRWLKVAAVREALALLRKGKKEVLVEESALHNAISPLEDQELHYLKTLYRSEFKTAFAQAFQSLEPKERTVLRYQTLDGLNIDEIGAVFGVHRATVARWIARVRETLLIETREALMERIKVNRAEFDSIMRLIQSQLDVSIHRLLKEEAKKPDPSGSG